MSKIIVIVGPTGIGKTRLSIELAKNINGEIVSTDTEYKLPTIKKNTTITPNNTEINIITTTSNILNPSSLFLEKSFLKLNFFSC